MTVHNSRLQPVAEKSMWQEDARSSHIAATVKSSEKWINACSLACLCSVRFLTLVQFRTPCLENGDAHSGLPTLVNKIKTVPNRQAHGPI